MTQEELRARFEGGGSPPVVSQDDLKARFEQVQLEPQDPIDPFQAMMDTTTTKDDTALKQLGAGFMDPFHGAAQLVGKGVDAVAGRETQFSKNISDYQKQRETDYAAEVPQDGYDIPRMIGSAANPVMFLGPGKVKIGGRALKGTLEALAKHSAVNALQAMAMPVDPDEDYWQTQKGRAAFGALVGTAVAGVGSTVNNAHKLITSRLSKAPGQATRMLKEMFGADAPEVARKLDALSSQVPGEKPTVGWASLMEDKKFPQLAAIENEARGGQFAGAFNKRDAENAAAQFKLMDRMRAGGTRPLNAAGREMNSPLMNRAQASAKPFYDQASQEMIHIPDELKRSIQGPEVVKALREGQDVVSQSKLNADAGLTSRRPSPGPIAGTNVKLPEPKVGNDLYANLDEFPTNFPEGTVNKLPMESIGSLQNERQAMDSLLRASNATTDPAAIESARLLREVRSGLTDRMRKASPNFDTAESLFKEGMAPQNRADYVTVLRGKMGQPGDMNQVSFLNALRDPTKTAKTAGIPFQVDSTEQLMGQGAGGATRMAQINALRGSAERDLALKSVYAPQRIKGDFADLGEELNRVLPPFLSVLVTTVKRLGQLLGREMSSGAREIIEKAALNPKEFAGLIRAASPEDQNLIMNGIRQMNEMGVRPVTGTLRNEASRNTGGM